MYMIDELRLRYFSLSNLTICWVKTRLIEWRFFLFCLSQKVEQFGTLLGLVNEFVLPFINDWAIIDCLVCTLVQVTFSLSLFNSFDVLFLGKDKSWGSFYFVLKLFRVIFICQRGSILRLFEMMRNEVSVFSLSWTLLQNPLVFLLLHVLKVFVTETFLFDVLTFNSKSIVFSQLSSEWRLVGFNRSSYAWLHHHFIHWFLLVWTIKRVIDWAYHRFYARDNFCLSSFLKHVDWWMNMLFTVQIFWWLIVC